MCIRSASSFHSRVLCLAAGWACSLLSAAVVAQQSDQADMQRMLEQAQTLQTCVANADQSALAELRTKSEAFAVEMKATCEAGKRDEAQARTIEFAREMAASPAISALSTCGEMAKSMLMPFVQPSGHVLHVCDSAF